MSKETIASQNLRAALIIYHASEKDPGILKGIAKTMQELANSVVVIAQMFNRGSDLETEIIQRCTFACLEKLDKFDVNKKTHAFNYFATVVLNTLRAEYRRVKKLENLKVKYKKVLKW